MLSSSPFSSLASMEYPGRFLMLGRSLRSSHHLLAYAVTGRSPSSQARRLRAGDSNSFWTDVTDPGVLARGNPSLLLYPCLKTEGPLVFVSNGAQTGYLAQVAAEIQEMDPALLLRRAFVEPTEAFASCREVDGNRLDQFEPDGPTFTPRISGVLHRDNAALSIARRTEGGPEAEVFSWTLSPGEGAWLTTYAGNNVPAGVGIPSFREPAPRTVEFGERGVRELAEALYEALGPVEEGPNVVSPGVDFRVGVLVAEVSQEGELQQYHIINRHGEGSS